MMHRYDENRHSQATLDWERLPVIGARDPHAGRWAAWRLILLGLPAFWTAVALLVFWLA